MGRVPGDQGRDDKYGARSGRDQEARAEEEIETATLDGEADPCEQRDDRSCKGHHRAQHEPELRQGDLRLELVVRDEERQRGAEQAEKEDLSPEPGLEIVSAVLPHVHSFGRTSSADKRSNRDG